ncbi:MAG: hypothetical protein J5978_07045 [Spirochaetaceae bacterium]|nr:hypothetical protein [Spirochaetaceae bacterium]
MKKHLINVLGGKYIYFLDVAENRKGCYVVTIGEISFNSKDLYNFLQTGEKKGVKNEN